MDPSVLWIVIIVGGIAAIGGYLFGMADSRVTNAFKESREKNTALKENTPGEQAPARLDEHNVLKVSVDPSLKWHLELDDVKIEPDGLSAEQRARLVNVIVQIRPWIDGKSAAPMAAPPNIPIPVDGPSLEERIVQAAAPEAPAAKPAAASGPLRIDFRRGFRSLLENEVKKPEVFKGPSIVAMIDDVLQKKLDRSPFSDKHIRLEEGSVGEVIVYVGVQRYSGVDAVPDEAIKALIKQAIAEWDQQ